jgi:hypothetical protein
LKYISFGLFRSPRRFMLLAGPSLNHEGHKEHETDLDRWAS